MNTQIKKELTTSEAKNVLAITDQEIRTIRIMINAIENNVQALDQFMDAMGLQRWIGSDNARSLGQAQFTIKKDD
tara:strand:- start:8118 stop:8342 length:225 start_codon:yes stop_codon:yes gene_type:complete